MKSIQAVDIDRMPEFRDLRNQKLDINQTWDKLLKMGLIVDEKDHLANFEGVNDVWHNEPCYVIGTSPGLNGIDLTLLEGFHTIGINHLIDFWDKMEWHLFIDQRFLKQTKYDYEKFKGRKFASNKTGYFGKGATVFQLYNSGVSSGIEQGLHRGSLSGLCAINLAIIAGARPIYLLGLDSGGLRDKNRGTHYRPDYTGESINPRNHDLKYGKLEGWMKPFAPWADRIINVDPKGDLKLFRKMAFEDIPEIKARLETRKKIICHIQTLPMHKMGEITRIIYEDCEGKHIFAPFDQDPPRADIYILHCFTKHNKDFVHWQKPSGAKVVSIVHSDKDCFPASCSDKAVFLTLAHRLKYKQTVSDERAVIINGGLDLEFYNDPKKDYSKAVVGRICRSAPEKFHPKYFELVRKYDNLIITPNPEELKERDVNYASVDMEDREKKKKLLSRITVGLYANGGFKDVFPLEVLEMMAMGIPVVAFLEDGQQYELYTRACETWEQVEAMVKKLCESEDFRRQQGQLARNKALKYGKDKMVTAYNKLLEAL